MGTYTFFLIVFSIHFSPINLIAHFIGTWYHGQFILLQIKKELLMDHGHLCHLIGLLPSQFPYLDVFVNETNPPRLVVHGRWYPGPEVYVVLQLLMLRSQTEWHVVQFRNISVKIIPYIRPKNQARQLSRTKYMRRWHSKYHKDF